jgi:UDP-N-acetylmuramoyl-tripeptide--D-alanyl-D-alanine ligase
VTFGLSAGADVRATDVGYTAEGVRFRVDGVAMESRMLGRHGVLNLLAGIATAKVFGIPANEVAGAVSGLEPGAMRGARLERDGILHLNDCYNSNPDAAKAMVDLLKDTPARRRIAVLGEMLELGCWAEPLHRDVGRYVAESGIPVLVGIRGAAKYAVDAAKQAGLMDGAACFFEDPKDAGAWLRQIAREGDVILWKGSRGTRVELALEKFLE